jgi:hypothetical protein
MILRGLSAKKRHSEDICCWLANILCLPGSHRVFFATALLCSTGLGLREL